MADDGSELIGVRVITRARRNEIAGERDGRLLVRTTAAPVDGKANAAVRKLVADHFDVPLSRVELVAGHHTRDKTFRVVR